MKILLNADCSEEKTLESVCALLDCVDVVSVGGTIREDNETTLRQLVCFARDRGAQVGALAIMPDELGHGSGRGKFGPREAVMLLEEAVGSLSRVLAGEGGFLSHVKLRGPLREACDERAEMAEVCVDWMESELEGVPLIVGAGGLLHAVAEARGVPLLREIRAGRVYADEARLVSHGQPGSVIDDPVEAARRIEEWMRTGYLALADGRRWLVEAETIGVSADSPRSVEIARAVREVVGEREKT